jgi:hypothetical protein
MANGSGQNRAFTALAFLHYLAPKVGPAIRAALEDLCDVRRQWTHRPNVLIVGSTYGGHGSGLFVLLNLAVRQVATQMGVPLKDSTFWGILCLSGGTRQDTPLSRANSYGILQELQVLQEGQGLTISAPKQQTLHVDDAPFDYIILQSVHGADGSQLPKAEMMFDLVAQEIALLVTSVAGKTQMSFARDQHAALGQHGIAGDISAFGTLAVAAAELPRQALVSFFERTAMAQLAERLSRGSGEPEHLSELVRQIARAHDPDAALHDEHGRALPGTEVSFVSEASAALAREQTTNATLFARIDQLTKRSEATRLPEIAARTAGRAGALQADIERNARATVERTLDEGHVVAAERYLATVLQEIADQEAPLPEVDEHKLRDSATALGAALKLSHVNPKRKGRIEAARRDLLLAHEGILQGKARRQAAEQLALRRAEVVTHLEEVQLQIERLRVALLTLVDRERSAAADALLHATRDSALEFTADALLRHRILEPDDA